MSSGEAWALVRERGKVLHLALLLSLCSVARCYELKMDDKRPDRAQDDDESGPARLDETEGGVGLERGDVFLAHHLTELWRLFLRLVGQSPKHPKPKQ